MSAALDRELLDQEWNGYREILPHMVLETFLRWYGDEARVTIQEGDDEETRAVFYGTLEGAERWITVLQDELAAADTRDRAEIWGTRMDEAEQEVTRMTALGYGDLERGYVRDASRHLRLVSHMPPQVIHVKVTETRERVVTLNVNEIPAPLRRQLIDGIVSDMTLADRGGLAIVAIALADQALVPVTYDRVERHAEQVFRL